MKYSKIIALGAIAAMLSIATSCDKNIDLQSDALISADSFFKSSEDFDKALARLYSRINYSNYDLWLDGTTDNGLTTHSWNNGYEYSHDIATPSSQFFDNKWTNYYKDIQWSNAIVNSIDNCDWGSDKSSRENYLGQAKALRAKAYLELVCTFGHILFFTENPTLSTANDVEQVENPKSVFDFVLSELDEAIKYLPETASNKCLFNKKAARLLRARAASYAAGYLKDKAYYQITIDETSSLVTIPLAPEFGKLFGYDNEGYDEVLMVKTFNSDSKNSWGNWYNMTLGGYCVTTPCKSMADAYEYIAPKDPKLPYINKEGRFYDTVYAPGAMIRGKYYNTIPNHVVEKDGLYYFDPKTPYGQKYNDAPVMYNATTTDVKNEGGEGEWNKSWTGLSWKKYFAVENEDIWQTTNSYIIFRAAEAYLLRAEALVETGGNVDEAKSLIKALRDRGGNTNDIDTATTSLYGGSFLNLIRNEFRVEMANEGLRMYDIRRWGIFKDVMNTPIEGIEYYDVNGNYNVLVHLETRTNFTDDYWWAIPQAEMDLNPRLKQNEGWK